MIVSKLKYKISPGTLSGFTLRIFKNYYSVNPTSPGGRIAPNRSNWPKVGPAAHIQEVKFVPRFP
jgi:hypothetical protein